MENYEYIDDLGSGSYGFVWKCLQRSSGKIVAVKGFKLAHTDKKFLDQAIREVRMLRAAGDHPNIVQLLEAFRSSSGRVYMVFEFVDRCLSAELHKRFTCGLPASQTRLVLWQLLSAVAHLHSKKIIHRDIKPGNLLMTSDGVVKLCDFGFARTTRAEPYQADRFSSYVVTRWYRSPEMLVSDLYSAASDIWSLGCTFAELATGRPLFPGTSSLDQLWRIMRCLGSLPPSQQERFAAAATAAGLPEPPPPPPRGKSLWQRLPELEGRLLDVVQACLRLDPAQRPTAAQLLQMPYFWEIPKLLIGTPLEQLYGEYGAARARTTSGRFRTQQVAAAAAALSSPQAVPPPQQQRATAAGPAAAVAGSAPSRAAVAVSVVSSNDLARTGTAGSEQAAAGGSAQRRNPPRQPSVLLSAVAASLLGEVTPQQGGSGSVPLEPLPAGPPPQAAPAPAAAAAAGTSISGGQDAAGRQQEVSSGRTGAGVGARGPEAGALPSSAPVPAAAAAAVAPVAGAGPRPSLSRGQSQEQSHEAGGTRAAASANGIEPVAVASAAAPPPSLQPVPPQRLRSEAKMQPGLHSQPQSQSQIPLAARLSGSRSLVLHSPTSMSQSQSPRPPSASRGRSGTVSASPRALPLIGASAASRRRLGLGATNVSTGGSTASTSEHKSLLLLSPDKATEAEATGRDGAGRMAAEAVGACVMPIVMSRENSLVQRSSGSIASASVVPVAAVGVGTGPGTIPGTRSGAVSVSTSVVGTAAGLPSVEGVGGGANVEGRSGSASRRSGGLGAVGLQPGFGLIGGDSNADMTDDGDGEISDDDELMEYYASKSTSRPRATTGPHAQVASIGGAAGAGAAGAAVAAVGSSTGVGVAGGGGGGGAALRRPPPLESAHAGVQAVHHGLYGSCHGSSSGGGATSLPGMMALSRRAVLAGAGSGLGMAAAEAGVAAGGGVEARGSGGGGGGGGGAGGLQPSKSVTSPSFTPPPAKRATVGSYLSVTPADSMSGMQSAAASEVSLTRPRTAASSTVVRTVVEAAAGASSYKALPFARPDGGAGAAAAQPLLPALPAVPSALSQGQLHGTTTTGIAVTASATTPMAVPYSRTSLPARGYAPSAGGNVPVVVGSLTQYGTSGPQSGGRRRALSRQGSVVFNQLMYDALPEIGTPGGAPDVPAGTPPRRRVVMSGFTPCRTAAARAAAEGLPPAAAMAAVMGEVLQSATTDISVPFSPIQVAGGSVDLLSPDRQPGYPASGPATATAGGPPVAGRRLPHRRQASAHCYEAAGFVPGSSVGAMLPGAPSYPVPTTAGGAGAGDTAGGCALHPYGAASAASDTGMVLGSSAPSYYRTPRTADPGGGAAGAAGSLSAAGPVPIPNGGVAGRIPTAVNLGALASSPSPSTGTGGVGGFPPPGSRSGHQPQAVAPAVRSRLASGNMCRVSDGSGPHLAYAPGATDGTQSLELDALETGISPSAAQVGGVGAGTSPYMPYHGGHMPYGPPMGAALAVAPPGLGRGRLGRWGSALIDSLPEDREVVHDAYSGSDWRGVGVGGAGAGGAVQGGEQPGDNTIQMLPVYNPAEGHMASSSQSSHTLHPLSAPAPVSSGRQPQLLETAAAGVGSGRYDGSGLPSAPYSPAARGWPGQRLAPGASAAADSDPRSPAAAAGGGLAEPPTHGAGGGGSTGSPLSRLYPFGRSRHTGAASTRRSSLGGSGSGHGRDAAAGGATAAATTVDDSAYAAAYGMSVQPADVAAANASGRASSTGDGPPSSGGGSGSSAAAAAASAGGRKQSGSGGSSSKWPRAKALLGGRLISSIVKKFKDSGTASAADK